MDPNESGTSGKKYLTTDWNKFVLCEEDTDEILKCPSNSAHGTDRAGYKTIAEHVTALNNIWCLPRTVKRSQLDDGQGIDAAFRLHKDKLHDSCRLQCNKRKLQRAEKRKKPNENDPVTHIYTQ